MVLQADSSGRSRWHMWACLQVWEQQQQPQP